jgi:hypothetical protein
MERMNQTRVHRMDLWKCHSETPCTTIITNKNVAGHWRLTPIILATEETAIRRITIQIQPMQIVSKTLS